MIELDIEPLAQWSGVDGRPLIVAGPCSAETEEQVLETAKRLAPLGVDYFRAGIWKPRTRPNSFEGIGTKGLPWLIRARSEHGLRVMTEVANPRHVELALEFGLDAVWLGARTTVSPFSVQEIADALAGVDLPVFVKNPINPDLGLWIGAIERVHASGVRKVAAIHRGFSTADTTRFRNKPMWELAIELKRMIPNLPILNDPSHIGGRRDLIEKVSQRAMDIGLDGLIVESHRDPENAWSDAAQQVTPERLGEILRGLKVRSPTSDDDAFNATLVDLREEIDRIDGDLIDVLGMRMRVVERIAKYKREKNVMTLQMSRWEALLLDRLERARGLGLSADYIKEIYDAIHEEAIRRQSDIMNRDRDDD